LTKSKEYYDQRSAWNFMENLFNKVPESIQSFLDYGLIEISSEYLENVNLQIVIFRLKIEV
jgi:hypothetical protein